jgi:hypothetical protein
VRSEVLLKITVMGGGREGRDKARNLPSAYIFKKTKSKNCKEKEIY